METFPSWMKDDYRKIANKGPLSTLIFGHRFKSDQTLYEYLTEFLLVFVSAKNEVFTSYFLSYGSFSVRRRVGCKRKTHLAVTILCHLSSKRSHADIAEFSILIVVEGQNAGRRESVDRGAHVTRRKSQTVSGRSNRKISFRVINAS